MQGFQTERSPAKVIAQTTIRSHDKTTKKVVKLYMHLYMYNGSSAQHRFKLKGAATKLYFPKHYQVT